MNTICSTWDTLKEKKIKEKKLNNQGKCNQTMYTFLKAHLKECQFRVLMAESKVGIVVFLGG